MSRLAQLFLLSLCILTFSSIIYLILVAEDIVEYKEVDYEKGKILDVRESSYIKYGSRYKVDGCNVVYSDEEGKLREYDVIDVDIEVCNQLKEIKEIEIKIEKNNRYSKSKEEIIDVDITKSLVIPTNLISE